MRPDLRLADLSRTRTPSKLLNLKVPEDVLNGIHAIAADLGCSKADATIALLNEGIDAFQRRRHEFPTPMQKRRRPGRRPLPI